VAGKATRLDARTLLSWGNASANSFHWWFGDGTSSEAVVGKATVSHVYAKPGTYKVRLTCSDTDAVNDSALPLACSAMRTTTRVVKVTRK
jgi:PKD repeat protein